MTWSGEKRWKFVLQKSVTENQKVATESNFQKKNRKILKHLQAVVKKEGKRQTKVGYKRIKVSGKYGNKIKNKKQLAIEPRSYLQSKNGKINKERIGQQNNNQKKKLDHYVKKKWTKQEKNKQKYKKSKKRECC